MERFVINGASTCRVVYPRGIFERTTVKGTDNSKPKYNCNILVPKDDAAKMELIKRQYDEAFKELQSRGFKGKSPAAIDRKNNCWVDGDVLADSQEGKEAFRGYIILKTSSENIKPVCVDRQKLVITNGIDSGKYSPDKLSSEELKGGDYVVVSISFWTYCKPTFQGIGCNLWAIRKVADGEAIGGGSDNIDDYIPDDAFEPIDEDGDLPF